MTRRLRGEGRQWNCCECSSSADHRAIRNLRRLYLCGKPTVLHKTCSEMENGRTLALSLPLSLSLSLWLQVGRTCTASEVSDKSFRSIR